MNVLIYGDSETSPALRHEVQLAIGDPFLYLEAGGRRAVLTNALEDACIARAAPDLERLLEDAFGRDELLAEGRSHSEIEWELCVRAVAALGIDEATVPPEFPLALADRLRRDGVAVTPDEAVFRERRHKKTARSRTTVRFLSFSTSGEPDIVIYPDSGKLGAFERLPDGGGLRAMSRLSDTVDYHEGERPPR